MLVIAVARAARVGIGVSLIGIVVRDGAVSIAPVVRCHVGSVVAVVTIDLAGKCHRQTKHEKANC